MVSHGKALLFGLLFAATPLHAQRHRDEIPSIYGSAEQEINSLAKNVDAAIKLCTELSARTATASNEIGKVEGRVTAAGLFHWVESPPEAAKVFASRNGNSGRVGQWLDPHATIWIVSDNKRPTCRILVGGSPWTPKIRPALYAVIQGDHFWKMDSSEQPFNGDLLRATFRANPPGFKLTPMITVVAPTAPTVGGVQLNVGVHLVNEEEK